LHEDSVVDGNAFGAGVVDVQEMACATCTSNGILICGRRTGSESSGANVVATMISLEVSIRPWDSGNFLFVGAAAAVSVGSGGFTFVSFGREVAALTGVSVVDIITMSPTVVAVIVTPFGGVLGAIVAAAIAIVTSAGAVLESFLQVDDFGVFLGNQLAEFFVAGCQVGKHLSVGCCGSGQVGKCVGRVIDKGIHGVVCTMVSGCLGGSLSQSPILVCFSEMDFEFCPSFICFGLATPFAAAFWEHAGVRNEGVCIGDDLGGSVSAAACIGVVHGILGLGIKGFYWLVGIVGLAEHGVIVCQVIRCDVAV